MTSFLFINTLFVRLYYSRFIYLHVYNREVYTSFTLHFRFNKFVDSMIVKC